MPGFVITGCEDQEFGAHEFELPDASKNVEGHYWRIDFGLKRAPASRPHADRPELLECHGVQRGHEACRGTRRDRGTFVAHMPGPKGGGAVWVEVYVANWGEAYTLHVVQETGMHQDVQLTAEELANALASSGSVHAEQHPVPTRQRRRSRPSRRRRSGRRELLKGDPTLKLEIRATPTTSAPRTRT